MIVIINELDINISISSSMRKQNMKIIFFIRSFKMHEDNAPLL